MFQRASWKVTLSCSAALRLSGTMKLAWIFPPLRQGSEEDSMGARGGGQVQPAQS